MYIIWPHKLWLATNDFSCNWRNNHWPQ